MQYSEKTISGLLGIAFILAAFSPAICQEAENINNILSKTEADSYVRWIPIQCVSKVEIDKCLYMQFKVGIKS